MVTESGGLAWMSSNMKMETHMSGGLGKAFMRSMAKEHAFQCTYTAQGVDLSTYFQKNFGAGLFSGEGFILNKITGRGMVFLEINGSVVEYDLAAGESIIIASGYLAAMEDTCSMDIIPVKGVKNVLFGGESLFNTKVTGPGRVLIQTMPITSVAEALIPYLPKNNK